jgi:hypothetical protein
VPVSRILFPLGDYFNVNDKKEETIHGTRQQEDTRQRHSARSPVDGSTDCKCQTIACGRLSFLAHDEEPSFYLGGFFPHGIATARM